jgi:hypothetical protein
MVRYRTIQRAQASAQTGLTMVASTLTEEWVASTLTEDRNFMGRCARKAKSRVRARATGLPDVTLSRISPLTTSRPSGVH